MWLMYSQDFRKIETFGALSLSLSSGTQSRNFWNFSFRSLRRFRSNTLWVARVNSLSFSDSSLSPELLVFLTTFRPSPFTPSLDKTFRCLRGRILPTNSDLSSSGKSCLSSTPDASEDEALVAHSAIVVTQFFSLSGSIDSSVCSSRLEFSIVTTSTSTSSSSVKFAKTNKNVRKSLNYSPRHRGKIDRLFVWTRLKIRGHTHTLTHKETESTQSIGTEDQCQLRS